VTERVREDASGCQVLVLEPYDGGSHRAFLDSWFRLSRHRFERRSLPARKWKWRMRGAALWFGDVLHASSPPADVLFTNDMLSVADLRALVPPVYAGTPMICYFHENQLTYPLSEHDWRDYQFGFTNLTSTLAADAVWFNSAWHREVFLEAATRLLSAMPDHVPPGLMDRVAGRSEVYSPVVGPPPQDAMRIAAARRDGGEPFTILWCHRWEYDKDPETFFRTIFRLDEAGIAFRLILAGESFRSVPPVFAEAWKRVQRRILHAGYVADRAEYWSWLARADVAVSTALQETFGIAVVEAMLAGCWPLLPDRLSYREIVPSAFHGPCLYSDPDMLFERLVELSRTRPESAAAERLHQDVLAMHDARARAGALDAGIERVARGGRSGWKG
jgi:glycosyltransferase involved in cell wall biosynthesis